ncbi:MAG: NADPH:quinone reductase [Alphaproteobacteria bacterium]|nr:NADPH:quinone reductase [Alphaproteobacteria bacterium]MCB9931267.1 NADPH:quinone reductase [Alphaproteobacteria bacterium]
MRAAWYERLGPAARVLQVGEQPTPTAGPGEVRVRLAASGVNPADVKRRLGQGRYTAMDGPLVIPNSDGAGVVDQVGAGVGEHWLGRRVWLYNGQRGGRTHGTAAEYIALDVGLVTPLADEVSFAAGACLGIPCMTAHYGVFSDGPVRGKTVLVTGGAGAVGHYAVQLAAWGGARVIATVSGPEKAAEAEAGGADATVNYRVQDVGRAVLDLTDGEGVDRVVDVDFGGNLPATLACLKLNGVVTAYASDGNLNPEIPFGLLMGRNATLRPFVLNVLPLAARQAAQRDITRWLAEGERIHRVADAFPLDRIVAAHEAVEAGTKLGTVIVEPERKA